MTSFAKYYVCSLLLIPCCEYTLCNVKNCKHDNMIICILCHCYLPTDLITTTIVPLLKNKSCDLSDIFYRAVALSSCMSKLLESLTQTCL